jgi:hypothetical protein
MVKHYHTDKNLQEERDDWFVFQGSRHQLRKLT